MADYDCGDEGGEKKFLFAGNLASSKHSVLVQRLRNHIRDLGGTVLIDAHWVEECTHVVCLEKKFERAEKVMD